MDNTQHTHPVTFSGKGGEFFGIWIVNVLLSIVTLGIYSAWAKVRTKRYFYGNTHIAGDNFEYHAKPMQILKGRLVALVVVMVWLVANQFFPEVSFALILVFYVALPWLLWSNARFDAAMTSYRNVHFSFNAALKQAYLSLLGRGVGALLITLTYFATAMAVGNASSVASVVMFILSLPLIMVLYAWVMAGVHRYFANGYQYGDWKFSAEIKLSFFIKTYCKAMLLGTVASVLISAIALFGLMGGIDFSALQSGDISSITDGPLAVAMMSTIYVAMIVLTITLTAYTTTRIRNYVFSQLVTQQADNDAKLQFQSQFTVGSLLGLTVSNFLLQVVTLGLARPWVMVRSSRYTAQRTAVIGDLNLLVAQDQESDVKSAITDEVAQAFDLGLGIS
ncbi:YjgN family protein [Vibrio sinaloensis]|uniref:YjgN family protein n=1 Tax=Photobacterium sp. (strain ATCC 43367) TaxID=379097 RepID=UPI0035E4C552